MIEKEKNLVELYNLYKTSSSEEFEKIDVIDYISRSTKDDIMILSYKPVPYQIALFYVTLIFHPNWKFYSKLNSSSFECFLSLYILINESHIDNKAFFLNHFLFESTIHLSLFQKSLHPYIMDRTLPLSLKETRVLEGMIYKVYYYESYQNECLDMLYKIHELNPDYFCSPPINNKDFQNIIRSALMLNLDLIETVNNLKFYSTVQLADHIEIQ